MDTMVVRMRKRSKSKMQLRIFLSFPPSSALQYYPLCFQDCVRVMEPGEFFTLREASIVFSGCFIQLGTIGHRHLAGSTRWFRLPSANH